MTSSRRWLFVAWTLAWLLPCPLQAQTPAGTGSEKNLARGKPARASSEQVPPGHLAAHAIDGDPDTRWCASGGQSGVWWQVDLGEKRNVRSLRIHWEAPGTAYRYKVETSAEGKSWRPLVDAAENKKPQQIVGHQVEGIDTRFLKITFLGAGGGKWGSIREFEAYEGNLPPLQIAAKKKAKKKGKAPGEIGKLSDIHVPPEFEATLFAAPPQLSYPVCLAAAATGEVYVGVDPTGSLGREKGRGLVLRCLDTDDDGMADRFTEFCRVDHPRGLLVDGGNVWVLHPPHLTLFTDTDGDGKADAKETLVTGLTTDQIDKRGGDHTTNNMVRGIDGWIYIAVGDFGFTQARGKDGRTLSRRGGGIVRVRPDGTDLEFFAWGLRNIVDVAVSPLLDVFTRDNTNDGGGWNVRVSHILQGAEYGYPSLYLHFADEIMPTLADYGGGSGCGVGYLSDDRWPDGYRQAFLSCDWGRSEVYRHAFPRQGPTFAPHQEPFVRLPRPTDLDIDGQGRLFVASWKNGGFNYSGPNVGFVTRIVPKGLKARVPEMTGESSDQERVALLAHPNAAWRLAAQQAILRKGNKGELPALVLKLAADEKMPLETRVAALFTYKQLEGPRAVPNLVKLAGAASLRRWALQALTDRTGEMGDVPTDLFLDALGDPDLSVRAQALIGLARLKRAGTAAAILPLTERTAPAPVAQGTPPFHALPDPGRVLPHLAIRALVTLRAVDTCLEGLDGKHRRGALWALRGLHEKTAVLGLADRLTRTREPAARRELLAVLARLYFREGDYDRGDWWGTRPDTTGPYYRRTPWAGTDRIDALLKAELAAADPAAAAFLRGEFERHRLPIEGAKAASKGSPVGNGKAIALPAVDPKNPNLVGNLKPDEALRRTLKITGNAALGKKLFERQSCTACHTTVDGQKAIGPHLADIGKRSPRQELIESILFPDRKITQGFDTYLFELTDGRIVTGFVAGEFADRIAVRFQNGLGTEIPRKSIADRTRLTTSIMPTGVVGNLTPEELAHLLAYLESLR